MLKKIFIIPIPALLFIYLLLSVFYTNSYAKKISICTELQIDLAENSESSYLTRDDIISKLTKAGLSPVGKELSSVNTSEIEKKLEEDRLIKRVECYKTVDGTVKIKVFHRIPVLRIFSANGSYYIDREREKMPVPDNFAAYVSVATGYIDEEFAKNQLFDFVLFLNNDKFWNSQIKQIYIAQNGDVELIPAVGNHRIILGKLDDYKENLNKLRLFYDKGLSKVGWNRYSIINLKYKNQVVCTI